MIEQQIGVAPRKGDFWFSCIDNAVICDPKLTPIDKTVFCVLCTFASSNTREAWPKIATIAKAANCSERSVFSSLKRLTDRGIIENQPRFNAGQQVSSIYTIVGYRAYDETDSIRPAPDAPPALHQMHTELEPKKELDLKDTLSEGADPSPDNTQTSILEEEDLKKIPSAMKETVEFLLLKTERTGLLPDELGSIMALEKIHVPARIQREITKAAERFKKQGKPLSALTFVYIFDSLKFQKSTKSARAQPKVETTSTAENRAWEEANLAALEAEFGIRKGGGNDAEL